MEGDKENHPGGCPSKLSPHDKQSIIYQIRSGKLDNTVQATQFINSTISNSVTPQTVRNVLKEAGFTSVTKKKVPLLKGSHHQQSGMSKICPIPWKLDCGGLEEGVVD